MSAAVMAMLARRWGCSVQEVRERIAAKAQRAGLIDGLIEPKAYEGEPYHHKLIFGVTSDDHIALLDDDDAVIMWLD